VALAYAVPAANPVDELLVVRAIGGIRSAKVQLDARVQMHAADAEA
jgi:hypothetical protein